MLGIVVRIFLAQTVIPATKKALDILSQCMAYNKTFHAFDSFLLQLQLSDSTLYTF